MAKCKDNEFDLAIVDPPYGINYSNDARFGNEYTIHLNGQKKKVACNNYKKSDWDIKPPEINTFIELIRISKNQIIWGANHFISKIPYDSSCWIVWNKKNGMSNNADCELAWTSFKTAVRMFSYKWLGLLQENMKNKEKRIHPCHKPISLYKWLLTNYAKPGQTIFDSHVGSGSIRIACYDMGFDFTGCELDPDYYAAQEKRFQDHISQNELFEKEELQDLIYDRKTNT